MHQILISAVQLVNLSGKITWLYYMKMSTSWCMVFIHGNEA